MGTNTPPIACPAGSYVERDGRACVWCKIEGKPFVFRENPRTVLGWCAQEYTQCPNWVADKERDPAVDAAQGKQRKTKCFACAGTGIDRVEKNRSGIFFIEEVPCDYCAGSGNEPYVSHDVATS